MVILVKNSSGAILKIGGALSTNPDCCCAGGGCVDKPFCYPCGGAPGATPAYIDIAVSGFPNDPPAGPGDSCFCNSFNNTFRVWFVEGANIDMAPSGQATAGCLFVTADWVPDNHFGGYRNCIAWSLYRESLTNWVLHGVMNSDWGHSTLCGVKFNLGDLGCGLSGTFTAAIANFPDAACRSAATATVTLTPGPAMVTAELNKNLVASITSTDCPAMDGLSVALTFGDYSANPQPGLADSFFYRGTFTCGGLSHRVDFSCPHYLSISGNPALQWPVNAGGAYIYGGRGNKMLIDYYDSGTSSWVNCSTFWNIATPYRGPMDRGVEAISIEPFLWTHAAGTTCCGCTGGSVIYAEVTEA